MTAPAAIPSEEDVARAIATFRKHLYPDSKIDILPSEMAQASAVLALFSPILARLEDAKARSLEYADTQFNRALAAEAALAAVVEALEPFADEKNGAMQDILWGDQPDSATMTITCPLGQVRKAREVVRAAAIRAQGE